MALSMSQLESSLRALTEIKVRTDPDYVEWLQCKDVVRWLASTSTDLMPIAVWMGHVYVYSVLVPTTALAGDFLEDIAGWSFSAPSGWGYSVTLDASKPSDASVHPPLESTGSQVLDRGEPIVFLRYFEGRKDNKGYLELNQRIAHIIGVHWMEQRSAYSRLDQLGDYDDVAPIKSDDEGKVVALSLQALEPYMLLTDTVLVRLFDVPRSESWGDLIQRDRCEKPIVLKRSGIHAKLLIISDDNGPRAGKLRGFQIVKRWRNEEQLLAILKGEDLRPAQYESFIAWDFKNKRVLECSCNPAALGNYFVPSDLPFETSPAFFRAEVLAKYKQDTEKYEIETRMISCRGGWHLQYDINKEGQVHAYLVDLGRLPHAEQVYWKSFNEKPKSGISERAYTTDFLGEWDKEYDPLFSLKTTLSEFPRTQSGQDIWTPDDSAFSRLSHVTTESKKEWEDAILNLAKLIVDGLQASSINRIAEQMECRDKRLRPIRQLKSYLEECNVDGKVIAVITDPFSELWGIRSGGGIAHRGTSEISDTRSHFYDLLARCDTGMKHLGDLINEGIFDSEVPDLGDVREFR